jgi:hypothetical protein
MPHPNTTTASLPPESYNNIGVIDLHGSSDIVGGLAFDWDEFNASLGTSPMCQTSHNLSFPNR